MKVTLMVTRLSWAEHAGERDNRRTRGRSHAVRQQAPQEQGPACLPTAVCPVPGTVPGTKQALEKHLLKEEKKWPVILNHKDNRNNEECSKIPEWFNKTQGSWWRQLTGDRGAAKEIRKAELQNTNSLRTSIIFVNIDFEINHQLRETCESFLESDSNKTN